MYFIIKAVTCQVLDYVELFCPRLIFLATLSKLMYFRIQFFKNQMLTIVKKKYIYIYVGDRENMGHHSLQTSARTLNYFLMNIEFSTLYNHTMYCCTLSISARNSHILLNKRKYRNIKTILELDMSE
jgi:hypothetical protein